MLQKKNNMISSKSIASVNGSQLAFKDGNISQIGNNPEFVNLKL